MIELRNNEKTQMPDLLPKQKLALASSHHTMFGHYFLQVPWRLDRVVLLDCFHIQRPGAQHTLDDRSKPCGRYV